MSWIDTVLKAYADSEAPQKFFYWSALASISAVMRKNVRLNRHIYQLYPNIYVFLVAGSGMKKGIPVTMAKQLVTKAKATRIISGRNSMPRILKDLSLAYSLEGGGMVKDAQGFLISGELAAFLVKDPDALTILTDLHNTNEHEDFWENSLKGTGVDKLKSPCLTLLGATNEEHFATAVPTTQISGGFIARTFIVYSHDKGKLNSLTRAPTTIPDTDALSTYLQQLSTVTGEFQWTLQAQDTYDTWYYAYNSMVKPDPTGTRNRLGDQVLKVAMLLSLAESPSLAIRDHHIIEAIKVCQECETGMAQVTMGSGKSTLAEGTKIVLRELLTSTDHRMERSKLLQRHWGHFDHFDLDRIAETLSGAEAIDIIQAGSKVIYALKKQTIDMYNQNVRSIQ